MYEKYLFNTNNTFSYINLVDIFDHMFLHPLPPPDPPPKTKKEANPLLQANLSQEI